MTLYKHGLTMNRISRMLAWRYVTGSIYERSVSIMVIISFIGIFIGSCALALVAAIMHGFDSETRTQMQGIHPQAVIQSSEPLDVEKLTAVLHAEFPAISAMTPTSSAFGLAQPESDERANPTVVMITAIESTTAPQVTAIEKKMLDDQTVSVINRPDTIIIGASLAEELNLTVGDALNLLYAADQQPHNHKLLFDTHAVTVGGIIKTGYEDLDGRLVLCSFTLFDTLFPYIGVQELQLRFTPTTAIPPLVTALQKRLNLAVYTWQDLYPALLAALTLEEYVFFLVIALITLVASMNILALLAMQIVNKRSDIALLKTIGLDDTAITSIFIYMGLGIALAASSCGIICATMLSFCIDHYKLIPLPDAYYVSHVPAQMTIAIPLIVVAIVFIMSLCAALIPTRRLHSASLAQILRFEG